MISTVLLLISFGVYHGSVEVRVSVLTKTVQCLTERVPKNIREKYYTEPMLNSINRPLVRAADRLGFSPTTLATWAMKESWYKYDAVSKHNRVKPPRDPWNKPIKGLDWGVMQIHCPGPWCKTLSDIRALKCPKHSMKVFSEWVLARMYRCKRSPSTCKQIQKITGDYFFNSDVTRIKTYHARVVRCLEIAI